MNCLIINRTGYDQDWAASVLADVFRKDMKACILPLDWEEGWASERMEIAGRYDVRSRYRYDIERPLRAYGIKDIRWLLDPDHVNVKSAIEQCDVLCLFGTDAKECMMRIEDLDLAETIRCFRGLLILLSSAASVLEAQFEGDEWDWELVPGLSLLPSVHFLMHYDESEVCIRKLIRMLERDGLCVLVLSDHSGVYLEEGHLLLLGEAFIADENDLDELYSLL